MKHECWRCGSYVNQETYEKYGDLCEDCYKRLNGIYYFELKEMLEENPSGDEAQFLEMLCDFVVLKCEEYDNAQIEYAKSLAEYFDNKLEREQDEYLKKYRECKRENKGNVPDNIGKI